MRNSLFSLANMRLWDRNRTLNEHVKSVSSLLPIPMIDIRRLTAIVGTLILVSTSKQAILVDLTQLLNRIQQLKPACV